MSSQDYYLEATFADGFIVRGDRKDASVFVDGKNTFHDIEKKLYEPEHGKLVNWAVRGTNGTNYDLDMTALPENARPILFKNMERKLRVDGAGAVLGMDEPYVVSIVFGAQWNDEDGKNHQLTEELE